MSATASRWDQLRSDSVSQYLKLYDPGLGSPPFPVAPLFLRTMWRAIREEVAERGMETEALAAACRAVVEMTETDLATAEQLRTAVPTDQQGQLDETVKELEDIRAQAHRLLGVATVPQPPLTPHSGIRRR